MDLTNQTSFSAPTVPGQRPEVSAAATTSPVPAPRAGRGSRAERRAVADGRKVRLLLTHLDPWSALKVSFVLSLVLSAIWVGACALLYVTFDRIGVVASLNDVYHTLLKPTEDASGAAPVGPLTLGRTVGGAALLGAMGTLLASATGTLTAVAYNACARLTGGVRVTLADES